MNGDQIRERIRVRLAVMGLTQSEICRSHGMSHQSFSRFVRDIPNITLLNFAKIARMLEVSVGWLAEGDLKDALPGNDTMPETEVEHV